MVMRWQKQLFYFFERWVFVVGKNKCAVCAAGFQLVGNVSYKNCASWRA